MNSLVEIDDQIQQTKQDLNQAKFNLYNSLVNINLNHISKVAKSQYSQQMCQSNVEKTQPRKTNVDYLAAKQKYKKSHKEIQPQQQDAVQEQVLQERKDYLQDLLQILSQKDMQIQNLKEYSYILQNTSDIL
ncbi:hypothetical protein SS50377_21073 [Spironucleus salmonicida]|uniref:Uncharacterized protein n=1 Tax=Spironucleus salmonicida TaxID=348837 RepID=A0A9P8LJ22_9EUKA|nr:hypothetical protein SS50377_28750 [Spironucleus salmonicida]KAH0577719.1 hypothetical protein SS50377_21073 [Spironucleus salmonicida]